MVGKFDYFGNFQSLVRETRQQAIELIGEDRVNDIVSKNKLLNLFSDKNKQLRRWAFYQATCNALESNTTLDPIIENLSKDITDISCQSLLFFC